MAFTIENFLSTFIRSFPDPFSAKELLYMLTALNYDFSLDEVTDFLDSDPNIFALQKRMYITRAGAFTGKIFSITLTQKELEKKVLVPGDRCIPFVDGEMFSFALNFEFLGKKLHKKLLEIDKSTALDLFMLFGEEYSVQYISSDPACKDLHIAENDFELPPKIKLTGIDIEPVLKGIDFKPGDRLLCRVKNWGTGLIELYPLTENKQNPYSISEKDFERQKWNEILEDSLLKSFDKMGPCQSIEEQLANVFYEHSKELCVQNCGSIHEFLRSSKKVSLEYFGVETRLWFKNQDVPAVGKWNLGLYSNSENFMPFISRPAYVIDSFIKDQCYEKKDNLQDLIKKALPEASSISEKDKKNLTEEIISRNSVLRKSYNWFADFRFGEIRHKALDLFLELESFVNDIDCNDEEFKELPQPEMVTLSQLFTHISRILEITSSDIECADDETYAMKLSIEGMQENFEEIRPIISAAMHNVRKKRFNVI